MRIGASNDTSLCAVLDGGATATVFGPEQCWLRSKKPILCSSTSYANQTVCALSLSPASPAALLEAVVLPKAYSLWSLLSHTNLHLHLATVYAPLSLFYSNLCWSLAIDATTFVAIIMKTTN